MEDFGVIKDFIEIYLLSNNLVSLSKVSTVLFTFFPFMVFDFLKLVHLPKIWNAFFSYL